MHSIDLLIRYLERHSFVIDHIKLGEPTPAKYINISYQNKKGNLLLQSSPMPFPFSTFGTRDIAADKTKTYDLAKLLKVSFPDTLTVDTLNFDANKVQKMLNKHDLLVIKPRDGLQSRGLSINISNIESALVAIKNAGSVSNPVLVQQQIYGEELRFAIIDGKTRGVLLREKPYVSGDNIHSIQELISIENISRKQIHSSLVTYPQLDDKLISKQLLKSKAIPKLGEKIELSRATMIRNGASVYNILDKVHPSYIKIAEQLVGSLPGSLICVDLMIENYYDLATPDNYSLIEINLGMSLPMCYSCRDGNHFNIIEDYIGPMMLQTLSQYIK